MTKQIEVNTILRRNGRRVQVSNIMMIEGPVTWDVEVTLKVDSDTVFNLEYKMEWDALRQEIDKGVTEVLDIVSICNGQDCSTCDLRTLC